MKYLTIGSVTHGTMRREDLIPTFWDALREVMTKDDKAFLVEISSHQLVDNYYDSEDAEYDLEDLASRLDKHCPPYCYFGANEGDGSDYGCWLSMDAIQDGLKSGELMLYDKMPKGYTGYVVDINDHGNVTLYKATRGRMREIWSIV